jgi:hypothetical protein
MAEKNWTHLFIDGRRVSFDRRDNSVTLFPDDGFRLMLAERIGHAEGFGNDWTATAPDGTKHRARGRTAAAKWLMETTAEDRARAAAEREQREAKDASAVDEALAILRAVAPESARSQPMKMSRDAQPFFVFSPESMRDLLVALTHDDGPRPLPLATALERVVEHYVVLWSGSDDPYAEPHPFEWGYLSGVAFEAAPDYRPDFGAYAEFWFEREDGEESMIGLPALGSSAVATRDAIVVEDEGGWLVVVIAEDAPETLDVPVSNVHEWDRAAIIELAHGAPPVWPDDDDPDAADDDGDAEGDDGEPEHRDGN